MDGLGVDLHTLTAHNEAQTQMDLECNTHKSRLAIIETSITCIEMLFLRNVGHAKMALHCLHQRGKSNVVTKSKQVQCPHYVQY